jgi:hypothetical protein
MKTRDPMDLELERRIAEEDAEPDVTCIFHRDMPQPIGPRPRDGQIRRHTNPGRFSHIGRGRCW